MRKHGAEAYRLGLQIAVVREGLATSVVTVIHARVHSWCIGTATVDVRAQTGVSLVELTAQGVDLAVESNVFLLELAYADGWRYRRHKLVGRNRERLLESNDRLFELHGAVSLLCLPEGAVALACWMYAFRLARWRAWALAAGG